GGPIALVAEGDEIVIDVDARRLDLSVAADELERRRGAWSAPAPRYPGGVLAKYAALVSSASEGAVTTGRRMTAALDGSTGSATGSASGSAFADTVISGG